MILYNFPVPFVVRGFLLFTRGFHMMRRPIATEELSSRIKIDLKEKNKSTDIFVQGLSVRLMRRNGDGWRIENTNFQNLKELLKSYVPKTFGIATGEECELIKSRLWLEGMEVTDLRNLRIFLYYSFQEKMRVNRVWWRWTRWVRSQQWSTRRS